MRAFLSLCALVLASCFDTHIESEVADPGGAAGDSTPSNARDAGEDASAAPGVRHPACRTSLVPSGDPSDNSPWQLDVTPAEAINEFTGWTCDVTIDGPKRCDATTPCESDGQCLALDEDGRGYCATPAPTLIGYRDGACVMTADRLVKWDACCRGLKGVDCRVYPFERPSRPGETCVDNAECEAGLVCRAAGDVGPRCVCPEVTGTIRNDVGCVTATLTLPWGSAPRDEAKGFCTEAKLPGYVREVIGGRVRVDDTTDTEGPFAWLQVETDADRRLHAFYVAGRQLHVVTSPQNDYASTTSWKITDDLTDFTLPIEGVDRVTAHFVEGGDLEVLAIDWDDATGRLHRFSGGAWSEVFTPSPILVGDVAYDSLGRRVLVYEDVLSAHVATERDDGWDVVETMYGTAEPDRFFRLFLGENDDPYLCSSAAEYGSCVNLNEPLDVYAARMNDMRRLSDGVIVTASLDAADEDRLDVLVEHGIVSGIYESEPVWRSPQGARGAWVSPRLAISSDGEIAIAYRTPQGMAVSQKTNGTWTKTIYDSLGGFPEPFFDANGEIGLLYTLRIDGSGAADQARKPRDQIGIVRRGRCDD